MHRPPRRQSPNRKQVLTLPSAAEASSAAPAATPAAQCARSHHDCTQRRSQPAHGFQSEVCGRRRGLPRRRTRAGIGGRHEAGGRRHQFACAPGRQRERQPIPRVVAELEVTAVAETSAVTDIHAPKRPSSPGRPGLSFERDAEALVQQRALSATRQYPAVISFTEGDTLDEEAREESRARRCPQSTAPADASDSIPSRPSATAPAASPVPTWAWSSAETSRASAAPTGI